MDHMHLKLKDGDIEVLTDPIYGYNYVEANGFEIHNPENGALFASIDRSTILIKRTSNEKYVDADLFIELIKDVVNFDSLKENTSINFLIGKSTVLQTVKFSPSKLYIYYYVQPADHDTFAILREVTDIITGNRRK